MVEGLPILANSGTHKSVIFIFVMFDRPFLEIFAVLKSMSFCLTPIKLSTLTQG